MDKFLLSRPTKSDLQLQKMPIARDEGRMFDPLLPVLRACDLRAGGYFDLYALPLKEIA